MQAVVYKQPHRRFGPILAAWSAADTFGTLNFLSTYADAAGIMDSAANLARAKGTSPIYSFNIEFGPDEKPTDDQVRDILQHALDVLGMSEAETAYAIHRAMEPIIVQVCVNRVNREDGKFFGPPHRDFVKLGLAMRDMAKQLGYKTGRGAP